MRVVALLGCQDFLAPIVHARKASGPFVEKNWSMCLCLIPISIKWGKLEAFFKESIASNNALEFLCSPLEKSCTSCILIWSDGLCLCGAEKYN
jgi:hypothetical protein